MTRVRDARERVETTRAELEQRMESGRGDAIRLKDEARRLVQGDREGVARLVLRRRQAAIENLRFLEEQTALVDKEAQMLEVVEYLLRSKVTASAANKEVAEARLGAAEARAGVSEALSGLSDVPFSDSEALQAAGDRTEYMLARADAIDELVGLGVLPSLADRPVIGIQADDGELDEEVEKALKGLKRGVDV